MNEKLCPTCGHPCEFKNGIMCTAWVCAKKGQQFGGNNDILGVFNSLFGKSGTYNTPNNNNYTPKQ